MNRPQSFSKFPQLLFNFAPIHLDASVCSTPGRESQHCSSLKQGRPSAPAYLTGSMAREAQLRQQRRTPAQAQLPLLLLLASSVDGRLQGSIAAQSSLPARAPTPMRLRGGEQTREPSSTAARDGEAGGEDNSGQIGPRGSRYPSRSRRRENASSEAKTPKKRKKVDAACEQQMQASRNATARQSNVDALPEPNVFLLGESNPALRRCALRHLDCHIDHISHRLTHRTPTHNAQRRNATIQKSCSSSLMAAWIHRWQTASA